MIINKFTNKSIALKIYALLFFLYIFAPLIIIFIFAWNDSEIYSFPLKGFTWKWFIEFFNDSIARKAILNSILIAAVSATISTLLAALLAIGLLKGSIKNTAIFLTLLLLPVLMPSLTIGIAALVFFRTIGIPLGIPIVIISHVSISMSYAFLIMMGRLESIPVSIQEASVDLGSNWFGSIKDVIIPSLTPAIIAGWLFSFMISWNEFIVTYFLIGNNITLPVYIFSQLRFGISPKVNVISLLITLFTLAAIGTLIVIRKIYRKISVRI